MAYTNRNFTWDFDALKRFYEKYIVKWLNSAVSWTEAQKKQARANLGFGDGDSIVTTADNASSDLDVADESGNILMRLANGHIKTKNFDSANIKTDVITDDTTDADLELSDENGNTLARFNGGHIKTKNFDSSNIGETRLVIDAKNLGWTYGSISSRGTYNYRNTSVVLNSPIEVKKGSRLEVTNSNVQMQVLTIADDGTISYTTWRNDAFMVENNCRIRFGVKYTDNRAMNNLGILDSLSVNLYVDKTTIPNRFDKRSFLNYNAIPTTIYRGRHLEDTGLTEDTIRPEAFIAPWDSLVDDIYVTKKDLGVTYQESVENGSPIDHHMYCYTFSVKTKNVNKIKPVVFICCNVHGHEKSSTIGAYYLMKDIVEHYSEDPVLNFLRNNVVIKVIPAVNAYGIINNTRQNGNGVNINRNYPTFNWDEYKATGSDTEAWGYNATGDSAASELETQYIINELLSSGKNTALAIDLHTNGRDSTYQELLYTNYRAFYGNYDYRIRDVLAAYFCSMRGVIDSYNMPKMNKAYGGLVEGNNYPSFGQWLLESTDIVGGTLEVPCGSKSDALGPNLTFYSKDTLKLCGELLGNYIIQMLRGLSTNDSNN